MGFESDSLQYPYAVRSTSEPSKKLDGMTWINPAGGASGNNTERYLWNATAGAWELESSVGPDTPNYPAAGAFWRDTGTSSAKQYDGAAWQPVGVNDHSQLTGVTASNHHSPNDVTQIAYVKMDTSSFTYQETTDYSATATAYTDTGYSAVLDVSGVSVVLFEVTVSESSGSGFSKGWRLLDTSDSSVIHEEANSNTWAPRTFTFRVDVMSESSLSVKSQVKHSDNRTMTQQTFTQYEPYSQTEVV